MLEPLRIRDFALLWAGMTTSLVGDVVFLVAFPWQAYQLTDDPAVVGWITALFFAPTVAFLLDRKSTRLNSSHVSESRMPSSA